jgi:hypothetical protein
VASHPSRLAIATTAGRVYVVSDDVTLDAAGRVSVLDAPVGACCCFMMRCRTCKQLNGQGYLCTRCQDEVEEIAPA